MFTFMLCSVDKVIFCTSIAWMVALSAVAFWSSQNCTALSSWMRLSISSMLSVGATQLAMPGTAPAVVVDCEAVLDRFCKKSKPGTNLPKPKADVSLMGVSSRCAWQSLPQSLVSALCAQCLWGICPGMAVLMGTEICC